MTDAKPGALFSIHDVMPHTLGDVQTLLDLFARRGTPLPALLIVPGRDWRDGQIERLREWEAGGVELIAHGWRHETRPRRLYHRFHAAFFSRNVAEHLALDSEGVLDLMHNSREWFLRQGLAAPSTYIPPAWALGLPKSAFGELPYRCVEILRGVILRSANGVTLRRLPLVGFEADTPFREQVLRAWNARQRQIAQRDRMPLRVSIHPRDQRLRLGDDLLADISRGWTCLRYRDLGADAGPVVAAGSKTL